MERSHGDLNEVTSKFNTEWSELEAAGVLCGGARADPIDIFCLHEVYMKRVCEDVDAHYEASRGAPRRVSSTNPHAPPPGPPDQVRTMS